MAKEVEGEKNAIDEQFVGGEEIGLWERRVSDHPELELRGVGIAASSAAAAGREGLGFKFESWALHGERSGGEAEKEEVGVAKFLTFLRRELRHREFSATDPTMQ